MSTTTTQLAQIAARLRHKNQNVTIELHADHNSFITHDAATGNAGFFVQAKDETELLARVNRIVATNGHGADIEPSEDARTFVKYLTSVGSQNRYLAMTPEGDVQLDDYGLPVHFRQRAAAIRNGRKVGAVAVWNHEADSVEAIS